MTPEEVHTVVKEAVTEAMSVHPCWMSLEDQQMVRDMVQGGKYVKRSILIMIAGSVIYMLAKLAGLKVGAIFK